MLNRKPKIGRNNFSSRNSYSQINKFKKPEGQAKYVQYSPGKGDKIRSAFTKVLFFLVILLSIYLFFFSGIFVVKQIKNLYPQEDNISLGEKISLSISSQIGKNIFFIDTLSLEEKIQKNFPELEKIKVTKKYPNKLFLDFSKYQPAANIINENLKIKKSYCINSIGYVIKEDSEMPELPYIKIKSDEPINTENAIIEKTKLAYMLESKKYYEDKFGMKIKEIEYKPVPREIHLLTERDFYIWLDIQRSYEEQFKKLKKALIKLDITKENLEYIDLRIAGNNVDKIIYKRK